MSLPTKVAHPIRNVLFARRIPVYVFAADIGVTVGHATHILNGRATATPRIRARSAELLDLPESDLFHADLFR